MTLPMRMALFILLVSVGSLTWFRMRPGSWAGCKKVLADYFDETTHPANLAMCRILLFGFLLFCDVYRGSFYASLPQELLLPPVGTGWLLQHIPITPDLYDITLTIFKVCCFAAMVGFFTPVALMGVTVLGWYVLGVQNFYGKVGHSTNIYLYAAAILTFSPCGDALSLDALFRRKPFFGGAPSASYARPLRMIWLLIGLVYFFPGVWKVVQGGPRWVLSENLKYQLYQIWVQYDSTNFLRIDRWPLLYRLSAVGTIVFELSFIFFLLRRDLRWICVVSAIFFHNMTSFVMGIQFYKLLFCYLTFIDWAWLSRKLRGGKVAPIQLSSGSALIQAPLRDVAIKVGLMIFAVNTIFGVFSIVDAWPFACFPTFGWVQGPTSQRVLVEVVYSDGRAVLVDEDQFIKMWRDGDHHKIHGLLNKIPRTKPEVSKRLCLGLAKFIKQHYPTGDQTPVAVRLVRETYWLDPERWKDVPIKREPVSELDWNTL